MVTLLPLAIDVLRQHLVRQRHRRLALGPVYNNPDDLVFTTAEGRRVDPRALSSDFRQLVDRTGLPRSTTR